MRARADRLERIKSRIAGRRGTHRAGLELRRPFPPDALPLHVSVRSTYPLSMYNCVIVTDESMTGTSSSTQYPIYINTSPISQASVAVSGDT